MREEYTAIVIHVLSIFMGLLALGLGVWILLTDNGTRDVAERSIYGIMMIAIGIVLIVGSIISVRNKSS